MSFIFQYTLKLAASELFKGKKEAYPPSVSRPYLTSHLCKFLTPRLKGEILCCPPPHLPSTIITISVISAHNEIQLKKAGFNAKFPHVGTEKVSSKFSHSQRLKVLYSPILVFIGL